MLCAFRRNYSLYRRRLGQLEKAILPSVQWLMYMAKEVCYKILWTVTVTVSPHVNHRIVVAGR